MSIDTKALNEAADTFARSWNALSAMEAAGLPPELDQDARNIARIIQERGPDYASSEHGDMTAPLLESLARLVAAAASGAALEAELASAREAERVQRERAERERDRAYLYRNAVPESADYVDALDHIMRAARRSRTQSRRLRWIEARARCALEGGEDWKELDLPRFSESNQRYLQARIAELEEALAAGGDR